MATRSRIGIQLADDSVLSVYCHWDGYPEYNGVKLKEHFNTRDKVAELIDGGDISSLWTNAGFQNETLPETGPLYYSARGEDMPPRYDWRISDYLTQDAEEYAYLYTTDGEWLCYDTCKWHDVTYLESVEIPAA
ncbi:MAG: hypothetical protein FJ211_11360 [Ignavibacteria bacterium]|nr:hypothetical protein [Ignavibacteria bacterium]